MRCRLILLITEHPIQQGIRKGGGPYFRSQTRRGRTDGEDGRTERTDRMAYSRQLDGSPPGGGEKVGLLLPLLGHEKTFKLGSRSCMQKLS